MMPAAATREPGAAASASAMRCPVCGGAQIRPLWTTHGFTMAACGACTHRFAEAGASEIPTAGLYGPRYFADGIYKDYVAERQALEKTFARFIRVLARYQPRGALLEVGAAHGFFLALARRHWQVRGVDCSAHAAAYARRELGLDVACADVETMELGEGSADVVAMWGALSLLRNPSACLAKLSSALRPGGILALTTADSGSWLAKVQGRAWRFYDPPYQRHCFSRRSLTRLLDAHGLDVVEVQRIGCDRSLNQVGYRLLAHRKPAVLQACYRAANAAGLMRGNFRLNLGDFLLVVARKRA